MTKDDIKRVLSTNTKILRKHKVSSISLFGSYVRNEQNEHSDIDFLVEFGEGITLFDIVRLKDALSEILRKKVTIVSKRRLSKYIGPSILQEAETIGEGF